MAIQQGYRVGIDVGGTFTDLALLSREGRLHVFKVSSRPADIAAGCLDGLRELLAHVAVPPDRVAYWSHGTTVATNAVVQRRGARIALLTTEGFRDVLEIRRQIKPDRYNLHREKPMPLVPRDRRLEVRERVVWDGSVHRPVDEAQLEAVLDQVARMEPEAVAVCFLHAYRNPAHEQLVADRLRRRFPTLYVAVSSEVLPEFREYPRMSTTVTNAYVGPVMERYLSRFEAGGRDLGIAPPLTVFQSNGGLTSVSGAGRLPVRALYSGPAAGVRGAAHVARQAGYPNVITFDMGGTSCDVCLIREGEPLLREEHELAGFPVRTPMIDVHSIGAGGGSIAWVDAGGLLQVGPQSAGAEPGPACYGLGGKAPTVTDANLVLGRLNPEFLLGGRLRVHRDQAHDAAGALARQLGRAVEDVALGILDVVNSNMMGAIRVVSIEKGYDYRDCALLAFGGAGPLHAADVAQEMGIRTVLVPSVPGILCALGLLLSDYRVDFTRTRVLPLDPAGRTDVRAVYAELEERARAWVRAHGIPEPGSTLHRRVHARYRGQSHQLPVTSPPFEDAADVPALVETFHRAHRDAYGYERRDAPVEAVDFHVTLIAAMARPEITGIARRQEGDSLRAAQIAERGVRFKSTRDPVPTPVYDRDRVPLTSTLTGPAIFEQLDSTTVVPPGAEASLDRWGNVRIAL